jgi:hypothetical protein
VAEIELDAEGEGSRKACYRNGDMSPPACHVVLSGRQLSREPGRCSSIETSKQYPISKGDHALQ